MVIKYYILPVVTLQPTPHTIIYNLKLAKTYSIATSIGIGILKEIIDERYRKGGEIEDMCANVGGVVLFRFDLNMITKKF